MTQFCKNGRQKRNRPVGRKLIPPATLPLLGESLYFFLRVKKELFLHKFSVVDENILRIDIA